MIPLTNLVGGFKHLEKYESQLGWFFPIIGFPIYGKIRNVWNHPARNGHFTWEHHLKILTFHWKPPTSNLWSNREPEFLAEGQTPVLREDLLVLLGGRLAKIKHQTGQFLCASSRFWSDFTSLSFWGLLWPIIHYIYIYILYSCKHTLTLLPFTSRFVSETWYVCLKFAGSSAPQTWAHLPTSIPVVKSSVFMGTSIHVLLGNMFWATCWLMVINGD